jgi:serine protease Do
MNFLNTIRDRKLLSSTLILFTLSIGIMIGTLINTGVKAAKDQAAPGATPLVIPNPVQLSTAFSQIAKQLEPSVVNISTTYEPKAVTARPHTKRRAAPNDEEEGGDDSMQEFFKKFFGGPGGPFGGSPEGHRGQALGSGVIVDPNGYILTNNRVVEKADRIQVTLAGTTTKFDAKLIGVDTDTDLAVIKIDAHKPLVAAKIGNSDAVQVGDWAVAIGSPFGLQATVTAGIISAKERDLGGLEHQFQKFLQTDAAINRGNSGGPLLAINGDVIGINTAILSESGGSQGVGFALPINTAAKVYNQIIKNGKVTRGAIGITFNEAEAKPELLAVYGAKQGVFVAGVAEGMPAAKAGIHPQDVIIEINGKPVRDGQDLVNRISDTPIGSQVKITALRDKKRQDFMVTIGDRKEVVSTSLGIERPGESAPSKAEATPAKLGISIERLTDARKEAMGFTEKGGVLVVEVIPGSFADDLGITETKDNIAVVISEINRQPVASPDDVTRIWGSLKPGEPVVFHIMQADTTAGRRGQTGAGATKWISSFLSGTMPNTQ